MLQRARFRRAQRRLRAVHPQDPRGDRQIGADPPVGDDLGAQLLAALPHDRGHLVLTRLHPAAGQLPASGEVRRAGALRDEYAPVPDQRGGDDGGRGGEPLGVRGEHRGPRGEDAAEQAAQEQPVRETAERAERSRPPQLVAQPGADRAGVSVTTCATA